jgi:MYXO-CTERM domain-containing protein
MAGRTAQSGRLFVRGRPRPAVTLAALVASAAVTVALGGGQALAAGDHIFAPGDVTRAIDSDAGPTPSVPSTAEAADKFIDGLSSTKYLNFGREGSGIIVTPGASVAKSFELTTGGDAPERDPLAYNLFGTNDPISSSAFSAGTSENWTPISSGATGLLTDPGRGFAGQFVNFGGNASSFTSYKLQFGQLRTSANGNSMQAAELQMFTATGGGGTPVLAPANPVVPIDFLPGDSRYPFNEPASQLIDGDKSAASKYLNFGRLNSGFIVTPGAGPTIARSFVLTTANDTPSRDPASYEIWGRNGAITTPDNGLGTEDTWTLITSGSLPVLLDRNADMPLVTFANSTAYSSYKIDFPTNQGSTTSIQLAEFDLLTSVPEPAAMGVLALGALGALRRRKSR